MSEFHYDASRTGLLLVDPYNDFLSDDGKLWPMVKDVADDVSLLDHLRAILAAARAAAIRVFFVPHRRWKPGDYEDWDHPNPSQRWGHERQIFAKGTWGGDWHPDFVPQADDIIVKERWAQSGFANTDLDFQLKQHGITHVVTVGMLANSCIESTGRFAMELGYHVTLVRDATAAFQSRAHACGARPERTDIRARHLDHIGVAGRVAPDSELGPALMPITNGMLTRRAHRTVLSKREIEI